METRKIVYRALSVCVLLLLTSGTVAGQKVMHPVAPDGTASPSGLLIDHVSDELWARDDAQRALKAYHQARAMGWTSAGKAVSSSGPVGSEESFFVYVSGFERRETKTFVKQFESDLADIWVEIGELESVPEGLMATLAEELLSSTPSGSINPNQGIIKNNNDLFGDPPDVDGDGKVDIIFYDIEDRTAGVSVLGYVWPGDLCTPSTAPPSGCGTSNARDVLYLDTNPLLTRPPQAVYETAAHEYQHLIHFAYDLSEETFLNEGLSEWAERANGYAARSISYLGLEAERNLPLLTWRGDTQAVLNDYQRASLFTSYLAERLGAFATGALTRDTRKGTASYRAALEQAGLSLEDVVLEFHAANLWNNASLSSDGRYGYTNTYLQGIRASVPSARIIDGRLSQATPEATLGVSGGGSIYQRWDNVSDFLLSLSVDSTGPISHYDKAGALVGLRRVGSSSIEFQRLTLGIEPTFFEGSYESITLVAAQVIPAEFKISFRYSATWKNEGMLSSQTIQYDNGNWSGQPFVLGAGNALATRFLRTDPDAILTRIWVAPFYRSQFSNGGQSEDAPRDFQLTISGTDGAGRPGPPLFSREIVDTRGFSSVFQGQTALAFLDISFTPGEVHPLPDTIFVSYSDAGSDGNELVAGLSPYQLENVSFIYSSAAGSWRPVWEVELIDDEGMVVASLDGLSVPIRVEFVSGLTVDAEEIAEVPQSISLDQNYPNPFNPATSIQFEIPAAQHVRLVVYDLTGRTVAKLLDEHLPSGTHSAVFDGGALASGVYFYALETSSGRLTRTMLLIK